MLLFVTFMVALPSNAVTLEGKVTYTVDAARKVVFDGIQKKIPQSSFQSHLIDMNYNENKEMMKYGLSADDRDIEVFYKGKLKIAYAIRYKENPKYSYYYLKLGGALVFIDVDKENPKQKTKYPILIYRYDRNGNLMSGGIHISQNEGFLYDKDEKLIIHRLGEYGYNDKGKRMWKAEDIEF